MLIDIRKVFLFLFVSVLSLSVTAQTLSEAEVTEKMEKSAALQESGKYAEAIAILYEILPSATGKKKDEILLEIPVIWYQEAHKYIVTQQYEEALVRFQKARDGFHQIGYKKYELMATKAVADIEGLLNKVDDIVRSYTQCIPLAQELGDEATEMEALTELYKIFYNMGEFEIAHTYGAGMDQLYSKSKDMGLRFNYMIFKGDIANAQRNFQLAQQWYRSALSIGKMPEYSDKAYEYIAFMRLRDLLTQTGDYDEALKMAYEVLYSGRKIYNKDNPSYYFNYIGVRNVHAKAGREAECFAALDSLFQCEPLYKSPYEIANLYIMRGISYSNFKHYEAARQDYLYADQVLAQKYPQNNPERVGILAHLGGVEYQLGHYDQSEDYYRRYEQGMLELHGPSSLSYFRSKIYLANAEGFAGHIEAGCSNYSKADSLLRKNMKQNWALMTAPERGAYWSDISNLFTQMTPYALKAEKTNDAFTRDSYNGLLLSKGFLLDSERTLSDIVSRYGSPADKADYMQLSLMRAQSKAWERNPQLYADSIMQMSHKIDGLASNISKRLGKVGDHTSFMDVDYDQVKRALQPGEVIIDFTDFVTLSGDHRYVAYVIDGQQQYPQLVPLFSAAQLDSLDIVRPDMYYYGENAAHLLKLIWEPLRKHISGATKVYYIPSQVLFQISLESLPLADNTLLGNRYQFVRLSSAREMLRIKQQGKSTQPKTAVLYGGLHYDTDAETMVAESQKYDVSDLFVMRSGDVRGDSIFDNLKGTMEEVQEINTILKKAKWQVTPYTKNEGTEESFLNMSGRSPRYLHLATHGFYYSPSQAKNVAYLNGYEDAMQLSGLVLSGGNTAWRGKALPQGVLGGILTAETISRLDLSQTEMVVLSACQTGQGKATEEGLYGLQRAFKKAGVKTIVMTLWNVYDHVAKDFMTTFYEQLSNADNKWDKRKAFEATKAIIREAYPEPYNWAAFIMVD